MEPTEGRSGLRRLRTFVSEMAALMDRETSEHELTTQATGLLRSLVEVDDWLPPEFAMSNKDYYQQYLLHCDSRQRFSVASFVWGPGQSTPIHDHRVWGLVGMLRGAEYAQSYRLDGGQLLEDGPARLLKPGEVETLSPTAGDIHKVSNASRDEISVSVHVYGANIGTVRRSVYRPDGEKVGFISGYANSVLPNFWGVDCE